MKIGKIAICLIESLNSRHGEFDLKSAMMSGALSSHKSVRITAGGFAAS